MYNLNPVQVPQYPNWVLTMQGLISPDQERAPGLNTPVRNGTLTRKHLVVIHS